MPLPLRWLNPHFLNLSSAHDGFKNIDMWSLVCIGIEMVSRGETPYSNIVSFNTEFVNPTFREPNNLATSILATVFERYLISSPDKRELIETNWVTITELITENPLN